MPVCVVSRVCVVVVCNSCTFSRHLLFASQFFFQQFTAFSLLHLSTVSYIVYYLWMWEASLAYKLRCWSEGTQQHIPAHTNDHTYTHMHRYLYPHPLTCTAAMQISIRLWRRGHFLLFVCLVHWILPKSCSISVIYLFHFCTFSALLA